MCRAAPAKFARSAAPESCGNYKRRRRIPLVSLSKSKLLTASLFLPHGGNLVFGSLFHSRDCARATKSELLNVPPAVAGMQVEPRCKCNAHTPAVVTCRHLIRECESFFRSSPKRELKGFRLGKSGRRNRSSLTATERDNSR